MAARLRGVQRRTAVQGDHDLNRYTRAQVIIKDPKVAALRITGMFRTGDIQRFGRTIAAILPVRPVKRDADTYELVAGS